MYVDAMVQFNQAFFERSSTITTSKSLEQYYQETFSKNFVEKNPDDLAPINRMLSKLPARTLAFQKTFISDNPAPLGHKDELVYVEDNSAYAEVHAKYHSAMQAFQREFGFYDVFLIEPKTGYIVYSVFKELDFATDSTLKYRFIGIELLKS